MMLFPWRHPLMKHRDGSAARRRRPARVAVEALEGRTLLSAALVKTINPTTFSRMNRSSDADTLNGAVYFTASDGQKDSLWKTNGTPAGTTLVAGSGSSDPVPPASLSGKLFFTADDGTHGFEPRVSDGTAAGTQLLREIKTQGRGFNPFLLTTVNGTTFFVADDGTHGRELWKSDGTAAGTVLVKDINPGAAGSDPADLTAVGNTLFFTADDGVHGRELWKSDGTAASTVLVKDIDPGSDPAFVYNSDLAGLRTFLVNVNGTLLFVAIAGTGGPSLWKSDGTAAGTVPVPNAPLFAPAGELEPGSCAVVNGALFFTTLDPTHGEEALWKSDGTAAGTRMVTDLDSVGTTTSREFNLTNVNGTLFFMAPGVSSGWSVWKSDGTAGGTVLLHQFATSDGFPGVIDVDATAVGSTLLFTVPGSSGDQVWRSDGTPAGTVLVAQTAADFDVDGGFRSVQMVNVNGTAFFAAADAQHGDELWKTDGTSAGTGLVKDINPGVAGSTPYGLTAANGRLYFAADDGTHETELWQSDGTAAGTTMVQDISPGPAGSDPAELTVGNHGLLLFSADDGTHGQQLWALAPPAAAGSLTATGSPVKVQEGQSFSGVVATFTDPGGPTDPGSYAATITWGDGHTSAGTVTARSNGVFAVSGSNTYAEAGSYAVSVHVTVTGGTFGTAKSTATVTDAPLYMGRTFFRVKKGQPYSGFLASLSDNNTLAAVGYFTVSIAWGDGHTSAGTLTRTAPGKFSISGGHTYAATGSYTAVVTVTDRGGRVVSANTLIAVDA